MYPNETLIELRQTLADMPMLANDLADRFEAAQELFTSLDQWLSKDGFLPDAWVPVSCPECRMRRTHTPDCSQR